MSYPKNPETIVLKNSFYPNGLTEIQIWNHYQKYKSKLLEQNKNRSMMMFLYLENGKLIVKKKVGELIRLNSQNYDSIISGRSISLHSLMNKTEDIGVIDIDAFAITNAFLLSSYVEEGVFVLVNVGAHRTNIVIYGPKGIQWIYREPEYARKMQDDSMEI